MATEQQVIDRVRRKTRDYVEPYKFDITYYKDAVAFALSKLSFDFGESYTTCPDVPYEREFLLVKLAVIEMCHVRAADILDFDSTQREEGVNLNEIEVPDLSVSSPENDSEDDAETWIKLAHDLQEEYDGELKHIGGSSQVAEVQLHYVNARSYKNGGLANRRIDQGIPATTLGAVVDGVNVKLSWSAVYHPDFIAYALYRSVDNFETDERILYRGDNHVVTHTDKDLEPGTYQYRVATVNPNTIKNYSNIIELTII